MKTPILIFVLIFNSLLGFSQIFENPSLSTYQIKIYYKGNLIRNQLLKPFQSIKIKETDRDGIVVIYFKRVDDICDDNNSKGKKIIANANGGGYQTTKNEYGFSKSEPLKVSKRHYFSEWWGQFGFSKGYHYLYHIYLINH